MLERLLLPEKHAIAILLKDHDTIRALFDQFEKSQSETEREEIIGEAVTELSIHAAIEEEIFYPAVRRHVKSEIMNEADEEHHVARVLIAELHHGRRDDDHRHAKFTVLAENVRHHIKEEEGELLPKAKSLDADFDALGQQMLRRRKELRQNGVPPDAEHAMVAVAGGKGDSPAAAARRTGSPVRKRSAVKKTAARRPAKPARARAK